MQIFFKWNRNNALRKVALCWCDEYATHNNTDLQYMVWYESDFFLSLSLITVSDSSPICKCSVRTKERGNNTVNKRMRGRKKKFRRGKCSTYARPSVISQQTRLYWLKGFWQCALKPRADLVSTSFEDLVFGKTGLDVIQINTKLK